MTNRRFVPIVLSIFAIAAIFGPGLDERTTRSLSSEEEPPTSAMRPNSRESVMAAFNDPPRDLQEYSSSPYMSYSTTPPETKLQCPGGSRKFTVDWSGFSQGLARTEGLSLPNGKKLYMRTSEKECAIKPVKLDSSGRLTTGLLFLTFPAWIPNNIPGNGGSGPQNTSPIDTSVILPFPNNRYCTTEFEFQEAVDSAFFSVGGITSDESTAGVVRISMSDEDGTGNDLRMARTGTSLRINQNYAYQWEAGSQRNDPPTMSSLYAKSDKKVKTIRVDYSAFTYQLHEVDNGFAKGVNVFPGLEFGFCAPSNETMAPTPLTTETPTPAPTPPPITKRTVTNITAPPTLSPAPTTTSNTTTTPTPAPTPSPGGTSGDPIIMGLSGQIFKFNGRSGAWYSAASAKSFQWNMKIQQFEGCPQSSDTFITGVGLTIFADEEMQTKEHKISVEVVNEYSTSVGCGNHLEKKQDFGCLGAGSLELTIDGHKFVQSVDRQLDDESGRVIVFNTIAKCSRRWFDFEVTPLEEFGGSVTRKRHLGRSEDDVLDIMDGVKDTMVDKKGCEAWMKDRRKKKDLFKQTGTWSTIMIKTDKISFHIEYKQEQERCNAHNIDVWISEVSPHVLDEDWEGVVGETKDKSWKRVAGKKSVNRKRALKYPDDESYEVLSPFSKKCKACIDRV